MGDTMVAGVWGTLGNRAGTMLTMRTSPWSSSAGLPLSLPLRIPILRHLGGHMGDMEA